jgi:hypothetical protein
MKDAIIKSLEARFAAYNDIIVGRSDEQLQIKLDVLKNKSLAEHLWCVVGARESYSTAIAADEWKGFFDKLKTSAEVALSAIGSVDKWTASRDELLLALFEHEVMHEDQLIRHMYGLDLDIPGSVRWS